MKIPADRVARVRYWLTESVYDVIEKWIEKPLVAVLPRICLHEAEVHCLNSEHDQCRGCGMAMPHQATRPAREDLT